MGQTSFASADAISMMPANAVRLALPARRKDILVRTTGLSVLLHLLLLAAFLARPHPGLETQAAGPISVELVPDVGTAEGQKQAVQSFAPGIVAPSEAPAMEPAPPASAPPLPIPEADVPAASAPPPPPTPPSTQAAQATPSPPAAVAPSTAEAPPVPAPQAAAPPPPPSPAPLPAPAPAPQQFALVPPLPPVPAPPARAAPRPPVPPAPRSPAFPMPVPFASGPLLRPPTRPNPDHTSRSHGTLDLSLGPEALNSLGAPPRTSKGIGADIRVEGAEVGNDWIAQLHEWWERHSFYPQQAIVNEEDGVVEIHMVIARDGHVESVEVVSSSGSRWLDMAGVSVFRNAHLRPFPLSTPEPRADVYAFLHYILVHG